MEKEIMLLHNCCGPCGTVSIERLIEEGWKVVVYYSNSNMDSKEEFDKRRLEAQKVAEHYGCEFFSDPYVHEEWLDHVDGFKGEPEGGKRCEKCFDFNLKRTYFYLKKHFGTGAKFTTSLTISPYKQTETLFKVGARYDAFEPINFKKMDGYKKSLILSRSLSLYRQKYCGCEFSKRLKKDE